MKRAWLATLLCFIGLAALAQGGADDITIGTTRVIRSQVLNEERKLYIHLPESYALSSGYRRYPVLYVRDGGKFFHSFTGVVQHLSSDATPHVPEMIVIGISENARVRDSASTRSLTGFTGKQDEGFSSSGGGANFRRFLAQELVPYIDKEFSTSSYRIYCGYSLTGLSVIDELLDASSVFDAFLMIDPSWWWDDYKPEKRAGTELQARKFNRTQLFIAASGEPYPTEYFIKARDVGSLADILRRANPAGLEWKFARYTDETHHSMAVRALYDGLTYFFRGYQPTLQELYNDPDGLQARYQQVSARLGEPVALTEGLLLFFGEQFLNSFQQPDKAIRYYQMAADAYPQSPAPWGGLGAAYLAKGDSQRSRAMYEKSLRLKKSSY